MDSKTLGRAGEVVASKLLAAKGFKVVERNFSCPLGEVDVIADLNRTRYFIEVKTRSSIDFGRPAEAVGRDKQQRIRRLAEYYIVARHYLGAVAFGVVEVLYYPTDRRYLAELLEDSF